MTDEIRQAQRYEWACLDALENAVRLRVTDDNDIARNVWRSARASYRLAVRRTARLTERAKEGR